MGQAERALAPHTLYLGGCGLTPGLRRRFQEEIKHLLSRKLINVNSHDNNHRTALAVAAGECPLNPPSCASPVCVVVLVSGAVLLCNHDRQVGVCPSSTDRQ